VQKFTGSVVKFEEKLDGAYSIQLEPLIDSRGFFVRHFCFNDFASIGIDFKIAQINHSLTKNVVR
jgi:dTDP-4-dehydrorhamnose 3,5-epimerase-like enzyme